MSDRSHPLPALSSSRSEADSAHAQADISPGAGDPYSPADRKRLDKGLRAYARHQGISGLDEHLDGSNSAINGELWIKARSLMHGRKIAEEQARIIAACESPIEQLLVEPLLFIAHQHCSVSCRIGGCDYGEYPGTNSGGHLCIEPQFRVPPYRVDFLITYITVEDDSRIDVAGRQQRHRLFHKSYLVIECDGRQFHDTTFAQKEQDRRKSRDLQALGYMVFSFSGAQITNHAYGCAYKSLNTLLQRPHAERLADAA